MGAELWRLGENSITRHDVDIAITKSKSKLFTDVHSLVFQNLSKMDKQFLYAMASDSRETAVHDLKIRLNKSSSYISSYRSRLIRTGLITSDSHGTLSFVLPYMAEYLLIKKYEDELR